MTAVYTDIVVPESSDNRPKRAIKRARQPGSYSQAWNGLGRTLREWGYSRDIYQHRLAGRHPVQLLASPKDITPGSATLGSAMLDGDLLFQGTTTPINERFWLTLVNAHDSMLDHCHTFQWLRDLAQVGNSDKTRNAAEFLIRLWIEDFGQKWQPRVWAPEIIGGRLMNWLAHAPLILSSMDLVYRSSVLLSMARQSRHLQRTVLDSPEGIARLNAAAGLTLAGLLLPGGSAWYARGAKHLEATVSALILPDGGVTSRNPLDAVKAMQTLMLVRDAYREIGKELPLWLQPALDRIGPFVRAMRHPNGHFAHFAGACAAGIIGTDKILSLSEANGKALDSAPYTGYQILSCANSRVIVDAGPPPVGDMSRTAHASTAAFEFSANKEPLVVNMGKGSPLGALPELSDMCRMTAAHSTLIIADRNSTKIQENGTLGAGVTNVGFERSANATGESLLLDHDGYKQRFGVTHERALTLRSDGLKLSGTDRLDGADRARLGGAEILLRFHIHPSVYATAAPDGRVTLETASGKLWIFDVIGAVTRLEDSLYMTRPDEPAATQQIVVRLLPSDGAAPQCKWYFEQIKQPD